MTLVAKQTTETAYIWIKENFAIFKSIRIVMRAFSKYLFPKFDRSFSGLRWLNIICRTVHLIGVAGCGGAFLYHLPLASIYPYLHMTLTSGVLMVLIAIWSNGIWLLQVRGVATLVKIALLGYVMANGDKEWEFFACLFIIIVAGIVSHAPGKVRYFYLIPRKQACRN